MADKVCAKCGFVMTELDTMCPRCKSKVVRPMEAAPKPTAIGRPGGIQRSTYEKRVVVVNRVKSVVSLLILVAVVIGGKIAYDKLSYLRMTPDEVRKELKAGGQSHIGRKFAWKGIVSYVITWRINNSGQVVSGSAAYESDATEHRAIVVKTASGGSYIAWDIDDKVGQGVEVTAMGKLAKPDAKIAAIIEASEQYGASTSIPAGPFLEDCLIKQ